MICAIHQPNFMPWYPFFQKIESSDIFVILENCQFEKNNFQNRFNHNTQWYTMRVNKGNIPIKKKTYFDAKTDWERIKRKLSKYSNILSQFDECISNDLSKTNINIIMKACELLSIDTKKIKVDYPTVLKGNFRLIDICQNHHADTYLAGLGSQKYLDSSLFGEESIEVKFQHTKNEISLLEKLHESLY